MSLYRSIMETITCMDFSLTGTGSASNYVPGQHGPNNRSKLSEYSCIWLKQKLRLLAVG